MLGVTGLILSGCFFTDEIKLEDIQNFKITVNEAKGNRQVHLTGLLGNSAWVFQISKQLAATMS